MGFLKEFKDFAMRGNVVDMAVGVVIGGAFGKIVTSLVNDVFMPIVGLAVGGVDFSSLFVQLGDFDKKYETLEAAKEAGVATLNYGNFLQVTFDFIIVALKLINSLKKKEEAAPAAPPAPSKEEVLLTEIRDLLKNK